MKSILLCTIFLALGLSTTFEASAQTIKITRGKSSSSSYRLAGLDNEEKANLQVNEQEAEEEEYEDEDSLNYGFIGQDDFDAEVLVAPAVKTTYIDQSTMDGI